MNYENVMRFISSYKILDIVPLDKVLHVIIGFIIYQILRKKLKLIPELSFFLLFLIALGKEFLDTFVMTNTIEENILDLVATLTLPLIALLIEKKKRRGKLN